MATLTVKQSGGDYSSLAAAVAAASTDDIISIEGSWSIDDTTKVVVASGVNNLTIKIGDSAAAHPGYWDTSQNHYRLVVSGTAGADNCININAEGTVIDGLAIKQNGTGNDSEGIRCTNGGTNTIKNCLITCSNASGSTDHDGIYFLYTSNPTITIENCIIWGFNRRGIGFDQTATNAYSATVNINSCTIYGNGSSGEGLSGGVIFYTNKTGNESKPLDVNIYNSAVVGNTGYDIAALAGGRVAPTNYNISASYSMDSDGSIGSTGVTNNTGNQNNRTPTDSSSPGAGNWIIFEDITTSPYDFRLKDNSASNAAQDAHSSGTGEGLSIPSTDILGITRPQNTYYDMGAFELEYVVHELSATGITTSPTVGTPEATLVHALSATGITTTPVVATATATLIHALGAFNIQTGNPVVGTPDLTHIHALSTGGITVSPNMTQSAIGQTHILGAVGIDTGTPTVADSAVGQTHVLATIDLSITPTIDSVTIGQIHILGAVGLTTTPVLGTPLAADAPSLESDGITSTPIVGIPSIGQIHTLGADSITITPVVNAPAVSAYLECIGITTSPTVGVPTAGIIHVLSADGISTTPVIDTPVLTHIHMLSAAGIQAQPMVDNPEAHILYMLGAIGITTNPTTNDAWIGQIFMLSAESIEVSPVIEAPNDGVIRTGVDVIFSAERVGVVPTAELLMAEKTFYKPIIIFTTED